MVGKEKKSCEPGAASLSCFCWLLRGVSGLLGAFSLCCVILFLGGDLSSVAHRGALMQPFLQSTAAHSCSATAFKPYTACSQGELNKAKRVRPEFAELPDNRRPYLSCLQENVGISLHGCIPLCRIHAFAGTPVQSWGYRDCRNVDFILGPPSCAPPGDLIS